MLCAGSLSFPYFHAQGAAAPSNIKTPWNYGISYTSRPYIVEIKDVTNRFDLTCVL